MSLLSVNEYNQDMLKIIIIMLVFTVMGGANVLWWEGLACSGGRG